MYKVLIEENTSMTATVKPNFGKTSFLYEALKKGDIDIYPEFTGTVTESLLQPSLVSHEPEQVHQVARDIAKQDHRSYLRVPCLIKIPTLVCSKKDCLRIH